MKQGMSRRGFMRVTAAATAGAVAGTMAGPFVRRAHAQVKTVHLLTTETDPNSVRVLKELIGEYEQTTPGIKIEAEFLSWQDMFPKIMAAIAARNPPEVVYIEDLQTAKFAKQGLLLSASDVVNAIGRERFIPSTLKVIRVDNEDWAVPATLQSSATYYRADWYREKKLEPMETWDDYLRIAKTLTDGSKNRYGVNLPMGSSRYTVWIFTPYAWSNGARYFDQNGTLVMDRSPNLERFAETLDFWKELSKYGPPGISQFTWLEMMQSYYTEQNAHCDYAPRLMTQLERNAPNLVPPGITQLTDTPRGPHGPRAAYLLTKAYAFMKGSRAPEEGKKFIRWSMETDRYIRYIHTVPGHMAPTLADVAKSEKYLSHPLIKANLPVQKKFLEIMAKPTSMPFHMEDGGLNLNAIQLLDGPHVIEMVQSVIIKNDPAKAAVSRAAQRLRSAGVA
jgi:multiple sugar transport system substrate-binding protein